MSLLVLVSRFRCCGLGVVLSVVFGVEIGVRFGVGVGVFMVFLLSF